MRERPECTEDYERKQLIMSDDKCEQCEYYYTCRFMMWKELTRLIGRMLTVAFIVLKLTNYVDWSWWWILAPILIFDI